MCIRDRSPEIVVSEKAHTLMIQALSMHQKNSAVVVDALRLWTQLADVPEGRAALMEMEHLRLLAGIMSEHHGCPRIAESFAMCLWQVSGSCEAATNVCKSGALENLIWMLSVHSANSAMVEAGQGAVWQLARCDQGSRVLESAGVSWGFESVAWHARHVGTLEYPRLCDAPMWEAVVHELQDDNKITKIDLSRCGLSDPEVASLRVALSFNYTVADLQLDYNDIEDLGAISLASVLGRQHLRQLSLKGNVITDQGAESLLTALRAGTALVQLDVSENMVSKRMCLKIEEVVEANKRRARNEWDSCTGKSLV
eukprot:TRINITY_DN6448_c0_g1_i1.p1 TRINITY_DN6448_c0_g1~~TRINITY_DN6448_c0_g1_i1.p1  ORF type:complete len:312 (+),score=78.74 TRINITY_DN6448_c0_g1_i1:132-1067(+)